MQLEELVTKDLSSRPLYAALLKLKPDFAKIAQGEYDKWQSNEGICSDIANAIMTCIETNIPNVHTSQQTKHLEHYWCRVWLGKECYDVDIPFGKYETYDYEKNEFVKIPNVRFTTQDIFIYRSSKVYLKAPWEVRKTYVPHKSDRYYTNESPDFAGYKKFNDREADLKDVTFRITTDRWGFKIIAERGDEICGFVACMKATDTYFPNYRRVIRVKRSNIEKAWFGTGLGQILYDRSIQEAKRRGYINFRSDVLRSNEADKAWVRLSKRYPVVKIKSDFQDYTAYDIDLTKVQKKVMESPDFGYKNFVNRDKDISKLKWKIEGDRESGIRIRAVKEFYDTESTGINGNYEGLIIARPSTEDAIQVSLSKLSKASNGYWLSTGLGQMLYDAAIKESKKLGFRYFDSDYQTSLDAKKAWTKLSNRYPVQKVKQNGSNIYRIDLTKVK